VETTDGPNVAATLKGEQAEKVTRIRLKRKQGIKEEAEKEGLQRGRKTRPELKLVSSNGSGIRKILEPQTNGCHTVVPRLARGGKGECRLETN